MATIKNMPLRHLSSLGGCTRHCGKRYITIVSTSGPKENSGIEKGPLKNDFSIVEQLQRYKNTFPEDKGATKSINEYLHHRKTGNIKELRLGIKYSSAKVAHLSRIIEAILAEPLAAGNQEWLRDIAQRDRSKNATFRFSQEVNVDEETNTFSVPSSMLSAEIRPVFSEILGAPEQLQDIELVELNELTESCVLELLVTDSVIVSGERANAVVVDNSEYTKASLQKSPVSFSKFTPSQNTIKVDSSLYLEAVEAFLKHDTKATDTFVSGLQNSNIYELQKLLSWYLRPLVTQRLLLNDIVSRVEANNYEVENDLPEYIISQFRTDAHGELQRDFEPNLAFFFKRKLPWWKLYLKNDNVEYELKDYFSKNFMNKTIEAYGYTRGRIVTSLQNQNGQKPTENFENPIYDLRQSVIEDRISAEIQPQVYARITQALLFYQVPLTAIAFLAYWHFDFTANAALALTSLGIVVGFNHVSKHWTKLQKKWRQVLYNDIRECIEGPCQNQLLKELAWQLNQRNLRNKVRSATLESLHQERNGINISS
ncbi:hypothetical protein QFC19_005683 [Naganishia cerealis]|uniref:Uncharacterized protein n=1 Tax=Naganishia cerealis TaxID=610337 RepID=A0ACC2VL54_9TREE|nr:hypothetical protein QFC19_005683 [Naganishia cerealis]